MQDTYDNKKHLSQRKKSRTKSTQQLAISSHNPCPRLLDNPKCHKYGDRSIKITPGNAELPLLSFPASVISVQSAACDGVLHGS